MAETEIEVDVQGTTPATVQSLAASLEGRARLAVADVGALQGSGRFALIFEDTGEKEARAIAQASIDQLGDEASAFRLVR